jgi:hypothetical protein
MSYNGWTDNAIGLEWFLKCFLLESKARLYKEYRIMVFNSYVSHISSEVIRACVANKVIFLCLPSHITHLF